VKRADSASAKFLYFAGTGTPLGDVILSARKAGASQDYLTITFSNTLVRGVQWLSGGDIPKEEVTFYYTKMSMSYSQQKADGTFAAPILGCFDIDLQQSC
jgi:type VI protein secretion system component Hcp